LRFNLKHGADPAIPDSVSTLLEIQQLAAGNRHRLIHGASFQPFLRFNDNDLVMEDCGLVVFQPFLRFNGYVSQTVSRAIYGFQPFLRFNCRAGEALRRRRHERHVSTLLEIQHTIVRRSDLSADRSGVSTLLEIQRSTPPRATAATRGRRFNPS
jgi:hypothetical protein